MSEKHSVSVEKRYLTGKVLIEEKMAEGKPYLCLGWSVHDRPGSFELTMLDRSDAMAVHDAIGKWLGIRSVGADQVRAMIVEELARDREDFAQGVISQVQDRLDQTARNIERYIVEHHDFPQNDPSRHLCRVCGRPLTQHGIGASHPYAGPYPNLLHIETELCEPDQDDRYERYRQKPTTERRER